MAQLNKKCLCDGTRFSYCPDCSRADALKPSWASEFCSETCMTLWTTLTKYNMNMLSKSEARSIISDLELKPMESYAQCVQRDYAKVMTIEKKQKRGKRVETQPIDEVVDDAQEIADAIIENLPEIKIEQPVEVAEQAVEAVHVVVLEENE